MNIRLIRFVRAVSLLGAVLSGAAVARAASPTTAECLAATEQSLTLRNEHKLTAARARLLVCAERSCPDDIRNECIRRVSEVNAAIPTIVFEAKDAAGNDLAAVKVTMDGGALADRLDGDALAVDPGEHAFTFASVGQPDVRKSFVIRQGDKDRRERVTFVAPVALAAPRPAAGAEAPVVTVRPPPPPTAATVPEGGPHRALAWIASGTTVAAIAVGVIGSIVEINATNDMRRLVDGTGSQRCFAKNGIAVDGTGASAAADCSFYLDRYNVARQVAIAGYVGAGALAVTSLVLWLTDGHQSSSPGQESAMGWSCAVGVSEPGVQCRVPF